MKAAPDKERLQQVREGDVLQSPSLSISGKGLILVAVPLLFAVVVFGCLIKLLTDTERDVEREKHARLVFLETTTLTASLYDLGTLLIMSDNHSNSANETVSPVDKHVEELEALGTTTVDAHESECIRRISLSFREMIELFGEIAYEDDSLTKVNIRQEALGVGNILHQQLKELSDFEGRVQEASLVATHQQRNLLKVLLWVAIATSIALGWGLWVYFSQNIKQRIGVIQDNSRRLASGEPLQQWVGDRDEITQLDRAFHSMAEKLLVAQKKERALVDNARDVICSLDSQYRFQRINSACFDYWGHSPDELIGSAITAIACKPDRQRMLTTLNSAHQGSQVKPLEIAVLAKDGSTRFALWTFQWSNAEMEMFCVAHDVTDRRELERLKEEFVAMVSHELRTPLTSINAVMMMLAEGHYGELNNGGRSATSRALESSERLIRLINSLLDMEKLQVGQMSLDLDEQPLEELLMHGLDTVKDLADKLEVTLSAQSTDLYLTADHDRITQVLVNLLSNAIKHSEPKSVVTISVLESEGDQVEIRVKDHGPGIPFEDRERIFDRFQQVKGKRETTDAIKGTGLGLPLAKAVVEQHGGQIGVDSQPGKGCTFWFRLPRARRLLNRQD
ncbi:MAG: PAS domain S-box protein [Candidatus Obscuribacterales bacterium]|nr:PAS domain S-box protein [Candidatus Obscuribacterales bacterium]